MYRLRIATWLLLGVLAASPGMAATAIQAVV
jgi:hypothetical protein